MGTFHYTMFSMGHTSSELTAFDSSHHSSPASDSTPDAHFFFDAHFLWRYHCLGSQISRIGSFQDGSHPSFSVFIVA